MVLKSHFAGILHSNYVPSVKELEELRDLISEPKERIKQLDEKIHRLQVERDELQQFVDDHSALRAPFRRLPADIWGEIFVYCLPTNKLNVALCAAKEHPLLLTTICRAWREVALNTPRLWSALHIHVPEINPKPTFLARLEGIKLWLDRSGFRPLTLSVSMVDNTPSSFAVTGFNSSPYTALMDLLACYSHRWRTLALDSGVKTPHLRPLERLTREDLPLLESIYITKVSLLVEVASSPNPSVSPREDPTPFANLLSQLPSLRSLHSRPGCNLVVDIASTYRRLTHLTVSLSIPPAAALRQIAMSCRGLSTLTIQSFFYPSQQGGAAAPVLPLNENQIDWPSLQELNLQLEGSGYYTGAYNSPAFHPVLRGTFDEIVAPQLRRLFVQFGPTPQPVKDAVPFQGFVARSPRLTHLYILGYNALDPEALSRCLQYTPSLTSLTVRPRMQFFSSRPDVRTLARIPPMVIFPPPEWVPKLLSSLNDLGSCPEMESFRCGGCMPVDLNHIIKFVHGESRLSMLKHVRAELGSLRQEGVRTVTSTTLTKMLGTLRETRGISVDLEWQVSETIQLNGPSKGMLTEDSPWASDSDLNQPFD
ncbi:hypothetical protein PQX77_009331 [Marasmius sp. AFHP31]|nr:hypothetical protein PQX77_009331 [Marasmius sp. AFHP31]